MLDPCARSQISLSTLIYEIPLLLFCLNGHTFKATMVRDLRLRNMSRARELGPRARKQGLTGFESTRIKAYSLCYHGSVRGH